ncbi:MAG: HRDC domain-containing protein [Magnetococcales bacterium]|nr:HRDC domain-containing protein [Magnetococcales bacterium]
MTGIFDDTEVRFFLADKEVHSIHDHAFVHQGLPHLALVVVYHGMDAVPDTLVQNGKNRANTSDESWRKVLSQEDLPLFNTLREWRASKAKEEGVPHYFICTNKQLADIAHHRPTIMTNLARIDGFGEGRLKKYGQDLLSILTKRVGTMVSLSPESTESSVPESIDSSTESHDERITE